MNLNYAPFKFTDGLKVKSETIYFVFAFRFLCIDLFRPEGERLSWRLRLELLGCAIENLMVHTMSHLADGSLHSDGLN